MIAAHYRLGEVLHLSDRIVCDLKRKMLQPRRFEPADAFDNVVRLADHGDRFGKFGNDEILFIIARVDQMTFVQIDMPAVFWNCFSVFANLTELQPDVAE